MVTLLEPSSQGVRSKKPKGPDSRDLVSKLRIERGASRVRQGCLGLGLGPPPPAPDNKFDQMGMVEVGFTKREFPKIGDPNKAP